MSLVGFKAKNHPQQDAKDWVDDRAVLPEFFGPLHSRYGFTIDAAASRENAVLPRYFGKPGAVDRCMWAAEGECGAGGCVGCPHGGAGPVGLDGLAQSWAQERVWCNPPYSDLEAWVAKAWKEVYAGCPLVVMLVPANRCEQGWWQRHVEPHRDRPRPLRLTVHFLPGRMRFKWPASRVVPPKGDRPPFGCALLVWDRWPGPRFDPTAVLRTTLPEAP